MPQEPVTQEQLQLKWEQYANKVKENRDESFYSTLTLSSPTIKGTNIEFAIANSVQEKDFDTHKQDLLDFLRNNLKNFSLELKLSRTKSIEKKMLYSDEERLKAMIKKNPQVSELIKRLNLDV